MAEAAHDKFLAIVKKRGADGVLGLSRAFRIMDKDKSGALSRAEFDLALKKFKVDLRPAELKALFEHYDQDGGGSLDFNELLKALRGKLTEKRQKLVDMAFEAVDIDQSGELNYDDIKTKIDTSHHPKVMNKDWTHEDAVKELLNSFDGDKGNNDGTVTRQEWNDYYAGISANVDDDDYFGTMMANSWGIDFLPERTVDIFSRAIKERATQKAGPGTNPKQVAKKTFAFFDTDQTKTVDLNEFKQAIETLVPGIGDKDKVLLFKKFDEDESGSLSYEEFLKYVFPEPK